MLNSTFRRVFPRFLESQRLLKASLAEPMQIPTQFRHLTQNNHRWRPEFFSFGEIGNRFDGADDALLRRPSTGLNQRHSERLLPNSTAALENRDSHGR
jgi:hypothetical protein